MKKPYIVLTILTLLISCGGREPIETVIKAWTNDDPDYTLESVYKKAPVFQE